MGKKGGCVCIFVRLGVHIYCLLFFDVDCDSFCFCLLWRNLIFFKKVWGICRLVDLGYYFLLVFIWLSVLFSLNHGYNEIAEGKNMFHSPWECVLCFPFIFSIFHGVSTMAFVNLLEKLKDMNIFLAPSIEKSQTKKKKKWPAYWEQRVQCDEGSMWFAESFKTMIGTRAAHKWLLMKHPYQHKAFFCVLNSSCSV